MAYNLPELEKTTMRLRKGDMAFLKSHWPGKCNHIIRRLISKFVDETKAEMEAGGKIVANDGFSPPKEKDNE